MMAFSRFIVYIKRTFNLFVMPLCINICIVMIVAFKLNANKKYAFGFILITRNALLPNKSFYCLFSFQRYVNGCNIEILMRVTLK